MTKEIPLTQGFYATVSDDKYDSVIGFNWHYSKGYAIRTIGTLSTGRHSIEMGHFILGVDRNVKVDHANRDKLNNQDNNLRIATPSQNTHNQKVNSRNTTGYRGVSFFDRNKFSKWRSTIQYEKRYMHLGCYKTAEEAAIIHDLKAIELFGEFAATNFDPNTLRLYVEQGVLPSATRKFDPA